MAKMPYDTDEEVALIIKEMIKLGKPTTIEELKTALSWAAEQHSLVAMVLLRDLVQYVLDKVKDKEEYAKMVWLPEWNAALDKVHKIAERVSDGA